MVFDSDTGCSGFKTRSKKFSASIFFLRVSSRVFCLPFFVNIVFITSHNKIFLIILVCFVLCKNKSLKFLSSQEHHKTHFPRFYFYFLVSENLDIKTQNKNIQLACQYFFRGEKRSRNNPIRVPFVGPLELDQTQIKVEKKLWVL